MSKKTMKDFFSDIKLIIPRHRTIQIGACPVKSNRNMNHVSFCATPQKSNLINMDRKKKRRFMFEKSIDLHGMTHDEAFQRVCSFFYSCQVEGIKRVLVITGGNALRNTVLRIAFRKWCSEILGEFVVSYTPANLEHGGEGAFYVILKTKKRY